MHPLEVPSVVWVDIALDFVEGFPRVGGKSVVLTVVDRFFKYAHFIALGHPYTAISVAMAFLDNIVRLHGILCSIVSDRDPIFTSAFWGGTFQARRRFPAHEYGISPPNSRGIGGDKPSLGSLFSLSFRGLAQKLVALAFLSGILLQHIIPDGAEDDAVSGGLWL